MAQLDRATARKFLDAILLSAADLDAFMLDFFPEVYRRLSSGMERVQRVNLLLTYHQPEEILEALQALDDPRVKKLLTEHLREQQAKR